MKWTKKNKLEMNIITKLFLTNIKDFIFWRIHRRSEKKERNNIHQKL
jgi:hypothetical protein